MVRLFSFKERGQIVRANKSTFPLFKHAMSIHEVAHVVSPAAPPSHTHTTLGNKITICNNKLSKSFKLTSNKNVFEQQS